ncbi:hypothetical protein [Arenicella xantha]|uniref:Uncharacterized protein n=1 Tax=Arenicella xantha TaxID=644221 RepID=A0A395JT61_9GAMM|nr:hypothetical protein [Arenicella xantha]RBP53676.1 hypothetical protein DFR28_1011063 [Arenicella xantha]
MDNIVDIVESLLLEPPRKLVPILENGHSERSSPYEIPDLSDYDFNRDSMLCGATSTLCFDHMSELDPRHTENGAPEKMITSFNQRYQSYVQTLSKRYREPQITGSLHEGHWGIGVASEIDNLRIGSKTDFTLWIKGTHEKKNIFLVNTCDIGDSEFTSQIWVYCALEQNDLSSSTTLPWWKSVKFWR